MGEQQHRDDDPRQQVSEDNLKEAEVSIECEGGSADDCKGAGFSGDDGKTDGPPWGGAAAQEIIAEGLLAGAKSGAKPRNAGQVGDDDTQIENVHGKRR